MEHRVSKQVYETSILTLDQAIKFKKEFDRAIGTNRETRQIDQGKYYVMCFDLYFGERDLCQELETQITTPFNPS